MADKRLKLDKVLRDTLGSTNVYFQPPESVKLKYPCIIYNMSRIDTGYADDSVYSDNPKYVIRYITMVPDDPMRFTLVRTLGTGIIQTYCKDGLYHYIYEKYF